MIWHTRIIILEISACVSSCFSPSVIPKLTGDHPISPKPKTYFECNVSKTLEIDAIACYNIFLYIFMDHSFTYFVVEFCHVQFNLFPVKPMVLSNLANGANELILFCLVIRFMQLKRTPSRRTPIHYLSSIN